MSVKKKKHILLIEDQPKTATSVKEALGHGYQVETVRSGKAAVAWLEKKQPDLIIIDYDLKGEDGLQVFRSLGAVVNVIMLSASGSIPLAVSATKLGVSEFLRKPIEARLLRAAVKASVKTEEVQLVWPEGAEWLRGNSPALKKMLNSVRATLTDNQDIVLTGAPGIPLGQVAEFIHINGPRRQRKFASLDLASFQKEDQEAHFWTSLQEIMSLPAATSLQEEADRYGTIFLANLDRVNQTLRQSIFSYFKAGSTKADKSIRLIIGLGDVGAAARLKTRDFVQIEVPRLSERKADLPFLIEKYLERYSKKYNRNVKLISTDVLDWLATYDFPGNYLEFEDLIEESILLADADKLELEGLPVNLPGLLSTSLNKALRENLPLVAASRNFEQNLYYLLLKKTGGEHQRVADFLELPKATLAERLRNLLD